MNTRLLFLAPLLAVSACAGDPADDPVRVDCGDTDVIVNREQANALLAGSGESLMGLGTAICTAFADVDASTFTEPREVTVLTANGAQVVGQVQASQQ
jgi:hypothetical protein